MKGWIKLHRKFIKWEWSNDPNMVAMFIYLLLMANSDDSYKWKGITIERGQLLTSIRKIEKDTGISMQTVRTCLKKLELTQEITQQPTHSYSIITICNYDSYQDCKTDTNTPINTESNTQLTQISTHKSTHKKDNVNSCISTNCKEKENSINTPINTETNNIQEYNIYNKDIVLNYKETTSNENNSLNVKIQNFDLENSNSLLEQENDFEKMFDDFRKSYKGSKRGFKPEFENLKKKRPKDWQEVIPKLMPALERMERWREQATQAKKFVPEYAMLQTWINQCRWETEYETINENGSKENGGHTQTDGAGTPNYDAEF